MKKLLCLLLPLLFIGSLNAQERFTVPQRTPEQKHQRTLYQNWSVYAAGINFAKSKGVSAYDYGKFLGGLFAQGWNKENGFDGFVRGMIFNYENARMESDGEIKVLENDDGSVVIKYPASLLKKYFPDGNPYASFEEALDCFRGMLEEIGDYLGCKAVQEVTGEYIVNTIVLK